MLLFSSSSFLRCKCISPYQSHVNILIFVGMQVRLPCTELDRTGLHWIVLDSTAPTLASTELFWPAFQ